MSENNTTVMIMLDRPRALRFSHKALKRWSAFTGKKISEIVSAVETSEDLEVLMFYGLEADAKANGEQLELAQMEDLLDLVPLGEIYSKVAEATEAAFPDGDKNEKNGSAAAKNKVGTGTSS